MLSTFGLAVLFGSFILIVAAWPEGPEYILAVRFLRSIWLLAAIGTVLYVVALSAAVRGESFGNGLNPGGWLDLFDAGVAGQAALARLVLAIACGWVVLRPERVIDPTTQLPAVAIPTLAVVTLGLSRTAGDLAARGDRRHRPRLGDGRVDRRSGPPGPLRPGGARRGGPGARRAGLRAPLGPGDRHHRRQRPDPALPPGRGSLFSDRHGQVLLLKTVLVAAMLFVGLTARQVAQTRLARTSELGAGMADRLRQVAFGTEAVIGVVVIALSGWLLALTPASCRNPRTPTTRSASRSSTRRRAST